MLPQRRDAERGTTELTLSAYQAPSAAQQQQQPPPHDVFSRLSSSLSGLSPWKATSYSGFAAFSPNPAASPGAFSRLSQHDAAASGGGRSSSPPPLPLPPPQLPNTGGDGDGDGTTPTPTTTTVADEGTGAWGTILALVKANVGPGVLFLPAAFANGGLVFSIVGLLVVAALSTALALLLLRAREVSGGGSFPALAERAIGWRTRIAVEWSLVMSQSGFCCVYLLFVAHTVRDVVRHLADCKPSYLPELWQIVAMELVLITPLTWVRRLKHFRATNLIADVLILGGLLYVMSYAVDLLSMNDATEGGTTSSTAPISSPPASLPKDHVVLFNRESCALFLGTAVFTFEGIGLAIPIYESHQNKVNIQYNRVSCWSFPLAPLSRCTRVSVSSKGIMCCWYAGVYSHLVLTDISV